MPSAITNRYDKDVLINDEKSRALKGLGYMLAAAVGIGGGTRALAGTFDMLGRDRQSAKLRDEVKKLQPSILKVPYPVYDDDLLYQAKSLPHLPRRQENRLTKKLATVQAIPTKASVPPIVGKIPGGPDRGIGGWLAGDKHDKFINMPWFLPAAAVATMGGLTGGYKLVDAIADKLRKRDIEDDVNTAREEYRRALLAPHMQHLKKSDLTEVSEKYEKVATLGETANNWAGLGTGGYLTLAGVLASLTGMASYKYFAGKNPHKLMKERIEKDMQEQWNMHPPEVYAMPVPIRVPRKADKQMAMADDASIAEIQKGASAFIEKYASVLSV